ncbi:MAG: hypothetical protein KAG14_03125, partial [Mycoplasmataceae bacterium]|nr:hypothetical protein [Mycoplasmataceae bacterium]
MKKITKIQKIVLGVGVSGVVGVSAITTAVVLSGNSKEATKVEDAKDVMHDGNIRLSAAMGKKLPSEFQDLQHAPKEIRGYINDAVEKEDGVTLENLLSMQASGVPNLVSGVMTVTVTFQISGVDKKKVFNFDGWEKTSSTHLHSSSTTSLQAKKDELAAITFESEYISTEHQNVA